MRTKLSGLMFLLLSYFFILACSPIFYTGISDKDSNPNQKIDNAEPKTIIVYYEKTDDHYEYFLQELSGDSPVLLAKFETLPADVIWDTINNLVYFVTLDGVLMKNYEKNDEELQKLSDPLPKDVIGIFNYAWIDRETGDICLGYGVKVDETNLAKFKELDKSDDELSDGSVDVIFGIIKLSKSGNWETLYESAYYYCPVMTPSHNILPDFVKIDHKYVTSWKMLNDNMYFYNVPNKFASTLTSDLEKYFKEGTYSSEDHFDIVEINENISLILSISCDHFFHNTTPCYFWENDKSKLTEIVLEDTSGNYLYSRLGLQITKDYLLIASECDHQSPKIYDLHTLELVWENPLASHAFIIENE